MSDVSQWDGFRIIGLIVAALILFWLASIFLFPLLALIGGILWGIAGLLGDLIRIVIFVALIGGIVYGVAHLLGFSS